LCTYVCSSTYTYKCVAEHPTVMSHINPSSASAYACTHAYIYASMHTSMQAFIHLCMHAYKHACIHGSVYTHTQNSAEDRNMVYELEPAHACLFTWCMMKRLTSMGAVMNIHLCEGTCRHVLGVFACEYACIHMQRGTSLNRSLFVLPFSLSNF